MIVKKYTLNQLYGTELYLGRVGENEIRQIQFDVNPWLDMYPGAYVMLFAIPPTSSITSCCTRSNNQTSSGYPVATEFSEGIVSWTIKTDDTKASGAGAVELILYGSNGEVLQSTTVKTKVTQSLSHSSTSGSSCGCNSSPVQPWIDQVAQIRIEAEEAADRAESAAMSIEQFLEGTIIYGGDAYGTT